MTIPIHSVLWVGGEGGMEAELVQRAGVPFKAIPAAGVHGVGLRLLPGNLWKLNRGYWKARRILREFRPQALLFTGGFVAVPMALAGRSIPSLLYVPDIEPGLALKTLARFSSRIAITADESQQYFPQEKKKLALTGYPTRKDLKAWEVETARQTLGLEPDLFTLLVSGGSKGALSINQALKAILPQLLAEMQVIHISGQAGWEMAQSTRASLVDCCGETLAARYHPYPYLHHEMGAALTVANLALTRAGASTLGELPLFGLPGILVPYPYAWRYQQVNASYLEKRGAAVIIQDADMPNQLLPTIVRLARNPAILENMRQSMAAQAHPEAAAEIAGLFVALAETGKRSNHG